MTSSTIIQGQFINLFTRAIYPAEVTIEKGKIKSIKELDVAPDQYILPGCVDAHVHIESSMLVPTEFARMAVVHGTVATVSDPHEIANVCGKEGVQFMIDNSKQTPFKIFFGAPSCVPATIFETAGAMLNAKAVEELLASDDIWYLSEMMNYPGVLHKDDEVMAKIAAAKKIGKTVDGHAPGLRGKLAEQYADSGITTDHESFTLEEAADKVKYGMYCLIREGSAAKNFDALIDIIRTNPYGVMFCSDDKHPDELVLHHINNHVKRALKKGYDLYDVLRAASVNPVIHYDLPVGLLRENDPADFIVIDNLEDFNILHTYINGELVAENGKTLLPHVSITPINNFKASFVHALDFVVKANDATQNLRVIEAIEGQLITNEIVCEAKIENGFIVSDTANDVLKIAVINRYETAVKPAIAFIKNIGLKKGALASTVAHDCHNIIAVGVDDESIAAAVNALVEAKGGISVAVNKNETYCLPLPIAGLMSDKDGYDVATEYSLLDKKVKVELGTSLQAPFMTLSFMALLVIPSLKLSDKGLFDGKRFRFTNVQI
ncbi:MAG TPA: adenine deaminase [Flavipsychrobacter sp.]|nr:adenine deaminase [Flavipsychrobacter sp.]